MTAQTEPAWFKNAKGELGVTEAPGAANNPRVVNYWFAGGMPWIKDDATPWCAGFVNAMLERAKVRGTRKPNARSFQSFPTITEPVLGCIVVLSRGAPWQGHVGFLASHDKDTVTLIGGNQGDKVSYAKFPKSRVVGYYWPAGVKVGPALPYSTSAAAASTSEA